MLHLRRQRPDAILIAAHWDEVLCFQLQDKHPSSSGYSTKRVVPKWGSAADSFCHFEIVTATCKLSRRLGISRRWKIGKKSCPRF
jgi:hypothetical protein